MRKKKNNSTALIFAVFFVMTVILLGVALFMNERTPVDAPSSESPTSSTPTPTVTPTATPAPTPPQASYATIYAVGDNLIHQSLIDDAKKDDGTYDFTHFYELIRDDIAAADIAIINQETIMGGEELGYAGYPNFNTPDEMAYNLRDIGFDVVCHATNHIVDKGEAGILGTLELWDNIPEMTVVGIHGSQEERDEIQTVEKNGITFSFLNYTYGLNGLSLPAGKDYYTNVIDVPLILSDVERAKELSDAVVVILHWGAEYSFIPSEQQRSIASELANAGVDLLIGHHPHVLQPVEWITAEDGHEMLCYYSLGNLVHSMEETDTMLGAAAHVSFKKDVDGTVSIDSASVEPLIDHYITTEDGIKKDFLVYSLDEYTFGKAAEHGIQAFDRAMSVQDMKNISESVLGEWYTDEDWSLVLVNRHNEITDDYEVTLVDAKETLGIESRSDMLIDERISQPLLDMFNAAKLDGIDLFLRSAYRTVNLQQIYYESQYNDQINQGKSPEDAKATVLQYTAYPRQSEHHTGLALDIITVDWELQGKPLIDSFDETEAYAWLDEYAHKYGFIVRFLEGKEHITYVNYEPWHFRYVGVEHATVMKEQGITLEEYLDELNK